MARPGLGQVQIVPIDWDSWTESDRRAAGAPGRSVVYEAACPSCGKGDGCWVSLLGVTPEPGEFPFAAAAILAQLKCARCMGL